MEQCSLKILLPAVQLAPPTLNVTKGRDGYSLSWEVQAKLLRHIKHTFQVQYKQDTASWEVRGVAWLGLSVGGVAWRGLGLRGGSLYTGGHSLPGTWLHR